MKKILLSILLVLVGLVLMAQTDIEKRNVRAYNNLRTDNILQIGQDSITKTTQMNSDDDTLVTKKWAKDSLGMSGNAYPIDSNYIKTAIREWDGSVAKDITESDTTRWGLGAGFEETDPKYAADSSYIKETLQTLLDTLGNYPKSTTRIFKTIPVTSRYISVNYGLSMTNPGYRFNAFAWYDSPTGRVYNGMSEPDTTLTGFTCTVNVPQGYLFYEAEDSMGFLSEESGWAESDPQYAADSASIKSTIRTHITQINATGRTTGFLSKWDGSKDVNSVFKDDGTIATIEQNSVQPFTSVANEAIDNTLYLKEGKVGIGTTTPTVGLHIKGAYPNGFFIVERTELNGAGVAGVAQYASDAKTIGDGLNFGLAMRNSADALKDYGQITTTILDPTDGSEDSDISLKSRNAGVMTTHVYVSNTGNVGIGTTAPDKKLEVNQPTSGTAIRIAYNDANGSAADYFDLGIEADGDGILSAASGDSLKFLANIKVAGNVEVSGNVIASKLKTTQISAALTDGTPTDAEIDTATGLTPATAGAGWECWIKDNNGSGLVYRIVSDGSGWYWFVATLAL